MKCLVVYWSKTGNTKKVALAIQEGVTASGASVSMLTVDESANVDFYDYDLVCLGSPSYNWRPPDPVDKFLKGKFTDYRQKGRILLGAPKIPGKYFLSFCTYSGPHTGINEAIPVGKYVSQFFDHLGFTVLDEWYVLSEFHGSEENSTKGRMGDIKGKPISDDIAEIRVKAQEISHQMV